MQSEKIKEYSNQKLESKLKELKTGNIINAFIIGFTIGIFIYSAINNGFGIITFFPLAIAYLIIKNSKSSKILENELKRELESRKI